VLIAGYLQIADAGWLTCADSFATFDVPVTGSNRKRNERLDTRGSVSDR